MTFTNPIVAGKTLQIEAIQSDNYVPGESGWMLGKDGNVQLPRVDILDQLHSDNYVPGVSGWSLDANGDVQLPRGTILDELHSNNYVEGETGWQLDDNGNVQVQNLNVIDAIGAATVTTDNLNVNGIDVEQQLANIPDGMTAFGLLETVDYSLGANSPGSGKYVVARYNAGSVKAHHLYTVNLTGYLIGVENASSVFDIWLGYSVDGSWPSADAAPIMGNSIYRVNAENGVGYFMRLPLYYNPQGDYDELHLLICMQRKSGSGNVIIYPSNQHRLSIDVSDQGRYPDTGGQIQQYRFYTPTPPTPPPPNKVTYTHTFTSKWFRSYNGDGSIYKNFGTEPNWNYQGYYSGTHGNTKSLVGFDWQYMQQRLSGGTIKECSIRFRVGHTYYGSGSTIVVSTHNNTSKPSTFGGSHGQNWTKHGSAGDYVTMDMPTSFANGFKTGYSTGIVFGPGLSSSRTYYAYMYPSVDIYVKWEK